MRIDPALAALHHDRALQRRTQAAMTAATDAWRAQSGTREVLAGLEHYGEGAPLASCPALFAIFADRRAVPAFVTALVRELCRALAADPFGHPPFRHGYDRGTSTLLLGRSGRAQLVLHAFEIAVHGFDTAAFSDAERHDAVLAGKARARIVHRQGKYGRVARRPLALEPGVRIALDLENEALQVLEIDRRLVSLRLHRSAREPGPSREYDLATGALRRQAAGAIRTSRHEAMLALLGRMGRAEAVPVMAAIAREPGDAALRWQALRECLALDTAVGFGALCAMARVANDPLAGPADALRDQLVVSHRALRAVEEGACLA